MADRYPALISKTPDTDWNVVFPDLPGCVTASRTINEALAIAEEALALHVHACASRESQCPNPAISRGS